MKKRERLLAILVGLLVVGYLGNWMFSRLLQGPLNARAEKITKLKADISKKQAQLRRARQASAKLVMLEKQSLPPNRSLYQEWLLDSVSRAGFKTSNVDSGDAINKKGLYDRLPFSVRGRGTLEQLTQFLFDFYSADFLHQIQRIGLTPVPKSNEIDLTLGIEALVLEGAAPAERLSNKKSDRLASAALADYRSIVDRNLFGQAGAGYDPADYAFLTAILDVNGSPQVWLTVRTTGEIKKLARGESFDVGQFHGTIAEINSPEIVIDAEDERWLLSLGEKLSQAVALPPGF